MTSAAWVTAVATIIAAAAAWAYTAISLRLWRATKRTAELTQASIDLQSKIYEATHRPFIGVAVSITAIKPGNDDYYSIGFEVRNLGSDIARGIEIDAQAGLGLYHEIARLGDLQPGETRAVQLQMQCGVALARTWQSELEQQRCLQFKFLRSYTPGSGVRMEREPGELFYSPPADTARLLRSRAERP